MAWADEQRRQAVDGFHYFIAVPFHVGLKQDTTSFHDSVTLGRAVHLVV